MRRDAPDLDIGKKQSFPEQGTRPTRPRREVERALRRDHLSRDNDAIPDIHIPAETEEICSLKSPNGEVYLGEIDLGVDGACRGVQRHQRPLSSNGDHQNASQFRLQPDGARRWEQVTDVDKSFGRGSPRGRLSRRR
jgi:hypothetical protein